MNIETPLGDQESYVRVRAKVYSCHAGLSANFAAFGTTFQPKHHNIYDFEQRPKGAVRTCLRGVAEHIGGRCLDTM